MLEKYKVLRTAEGYAVNGKYANAIREYRRLLEQEGDDPALLNTFGDLLLKQGEREEALATFHRVSDIYSESGFVTKAIAICKKVRQLKPADAEASQKLAELYLRQGLNRQAAPLLLEAAGEHQEWGRVEEAARSLERLLELEDTPAARRQMAVLCLQSEKPDQAALHFAQAAQLYEAEGRLEESQECEKEARRLGLEPPPEAAAPASDADSAAPALEEEEEVDRAIADAPESTPADSSRVTESKPQPEAGDDLLLDNSGAAVGPPPASAPPAAENDAAIGFELMDNGFGAAAATAAGSRADVDDPDDFDLLDETDPAAASWDLAEEDGPDLPATPPPEPWDGPPEEGLEEADFYLKLGLHDDARNVLKRLLTTFPEDERVLTRADKARLPLPERTVEVVEAPAAGEGESFEMEVDLALDVLFEDTGEAAAPEVLRYDVAREVRAGDDNDPKVHYDLGLAYKEMGLVEDCVEKFRQAYQRFEDAENAPQRVLCCSMLANAFLQLEDFVEAAEWARRGLDLPGKKEFEWKALQYDASQALERLGERQEALTGYRRISETDPDYRDVGSRIDALSLQIGHD